MEAARQAAAPSATDEAFIDLVCADDALLHAAFEAIVTEEWPVPPSPPSPPRGAGSPDPAGWRRDRPARRGRGQARSHRPVRRVGRQRSPPRAERVLVVVS
jgi:hypothetical protein